jgi:hypothetical protein
MRELVTPQSPEEASVWADEYRRDHRETGPWHLIDSIDKLLLFTQICPSV